MRASTKKALAYVKPMLLKNSEVLLLASKSTNNINQPFYIVEPK